MNILTSLEREEELFFDFDFEEGFEDLGILVLVVFFVAIIIYKPFCQKILLK